MVLSAKAFSQNLLVHHDAVRGYALGVHWLLESLMTGTNVIIDAVSDPKRAAESYITCRIVHTNRPLEDLHKLGELLQAIHRARDGVAGNEVRTRIETSSADSIRQLLPVVNSEGILQYRSTASAEEQTLLIWLEK